MSKMLITLTKKNETYNSKAVNSSDSDSLFIIPDWLLLLSFERGNKQKKEMIAIKNALAESAGEKKPRRKQVAFRETSKRSS